ncbi:MAG TPA: PIN domain-containing protein [Spirochaetia bacterium]|nr:PIN domain-containing protein [Spirochaetia bacterium]
MIIIDTSVWIEFLKGGQSYSSAVKVLLEQREVLAVECIFAELLQGAKTDRERTIILSYWNHLPKIEDPGLLIEAGLYSGQTRLLDKGVGLIDALILICALKSGAKIWTLDNKFAKIIPRGFVYCAC